MDFEWRLLQLFLAANADEARVFEVWFLPGRRIYRCTCPGFRMRQQCRHVGYIIRQVNQHGGYTPPLATPWAMDLLTDEIKSDPLMFRCWLYDNSHILILDAEGQVVNPPQAVMP